MNLVRSHYQSSFSFCLKGIKVDDKFNRFSMHKDEIISIAEEVLGKDFENEYK